MKLWKVSNRSYYWKAKNLFIGRNITVSRYFVLNHKLSYLSEILAYIDVDANTKTFRKLSNVTSILIVVLPEKSHQSLQSEHHTLNSQSAIKVRVWKTFIGLSLLPNLALLFQTGRSFLSL